MQIRKATTQDLECVQELTRETICQIYPKYYPTGAVQFFLNHLRQENFSRYSAGVRVSG